MLVLRGGNEAERQVLHPLRTIARRHRMPGMRHTELPQLLPQMQCSAHSDGASRRRSRQERPSLQSHPSKSAELAELHARIEELRNAAETDEESLPQLSEADCALLDEYADILGSIGAVKPKPQAVTTPETPARQQYADITLSMDDIMAAYRSKAAEMDAALAALTPPPDFTPEQQRDYFSARKIGKVHTEYDMSGYPPSQWVCNFCGFRHNNPSECSEPQLGGTWIYVTPEQYVQENKSYLASQSSFVIE